MTRQLLNDSWIAAYDAETLVGGHTNPISGGTTVKQVLTDYHAAVQFIHDNTVEGMNQALTKDELVTYEQLPEDLTSRDYLQPFCGHPEWGVRSLFDVCLGWFDGNPTNLFRLSPTSEAGWVTTLAGGKNKLLAAAKQALVADDEQWSAQLADHLLTINKGNAEARHIKSDSLTKLASNMVNASARNYDLAVAGELHEAAKAE